MRPQIGIRLNAFISCPNKHSYSFWLNSFFRMWFDFMAPVSHRGLDNGCPQLNKVGSMYLTQTNCHRWHCFRIAQQKGSDFRLMAFGICGLRLPICVIYILPNKVGSMCLTQTSCRIGIANRLGNTSARGFRLPTFGICALKLPICVIYVLPNKVVHRAFDIIIFPPTLSSQKMGNQGYWAGGFLE